MSLKVLGISTSPRLKGNSDLLLREALTGAESAGTQVEYLRLCDLKIGPCVECNCCYTTGRCRVEDDYQMVLEKMLDADRLIFATPIFFMTVCSQAKMLIDRGQCLWAAKHVLKKPLFETGRRDRRAMVIAVGGSASTKQFDSIRLTMKAYFDVLDIKYVANLFINKVDAHGAIMTHPTALKEVFRLGKELASADTLLPEKPIDVLLT
ncbi:MAG: flavodoxin family protein [Sedimentisphaerales bacterium]